MKLDRKQVKKQTMFMGGLASFSGLVPIASATGLFTMQNCLLIATSFMVGPAAILVAAFSSGTTSERILCALISGLLATGIVIIAATLGPKLLVLVNLKLLKIISGIGIMAIAFLIMGVKMNEQIPTAIMILGLVASVIFR